MKKIIYFVIGFVCAPVILGDLFAWISSADAFIYDGICGTLYLILYLIFPWLYRGKISQILKNKTLAFVCIYTILATILCGILSLMI